MRKFNVYDINCFVMIHDTKVTNLIRSNYFNFSNFTISVNVNEFRSSGRDPFNRMDSSFIEIEQIPTSHFTTVMIDQLVT